MTNLEHAYLEVEHNGETHEASVTYGSWTARDEHGESFVDFEIYKIDCDVELPEVVVGSHLADHLAFIFPDEIC